MGAFGIVEYLIFGFIGVNAALAATFVLHQGVSRLRGPSD